MIDVFSSKIKKKSFLDYELFAKTFFNDLQAGSGQKYHPVYFDTLYAEVSPKWIQKKYLSISAIGWGFDDFGCGLWRSKYRIRHTSSKYPKLMKIGF